MKKLLKLSSTLLCFCLLLNSCSSKLTLPNRLSPENAPQLQEYDYTGFSHKNLLENIKTFNADLSLPEKELTGAKLQKMENDLSAILKEYKKFKAIKFNRGEAAFSIPPNSKTTFNFKSYCLNAGRGSPSAGEQFVLRKNSPDIPLFKEIMVYSNSAKDAKPVNKQHLLWNLRNNVKFENLPENQQAFLFAMDPLSYLKINNFFKAELKSQLTKYANKQIPLYGQVTDTVRLVKGQTYTYEQYARNIENFAAKVNLVDDSSPVKSDGYDGVFTQTRSSGYSGTTIIFINTNSLPVVIFCASFLDPMRKGIQPIGFDLPGIFGDHEKYESEIDNEFMNLLGKIAQYLGYIGEGEVKTLSDNPDKIGDLFKAYKTKKLAFDRTIKEFGYNGEDDIADAFRHAFWSATMVKAVGAAFAEEIATNHEIGVKDIAAKNMDLHNNKIGREIALDLISRGITDDDSFAAEILKNKDRLIQAPKR